MDRSELLRKGYIYNTALEGGPEIRDGKSLPEPGQETLEESVRLFLLGVGENPYREGLKDTPKRIAKAYMECLSGYNEDPKDFITEFDNDIYKGPVILKGAELYSFCEHHGFPFIGAVDIAYQPKDKIVGLSKLVRVARVFAKRLQVQERLTQQIADALWEILEPEWVIVRYTAEHFCMRIRGVRVKESTTTTIATHGWVPSDIFNQ